MMYLATNRILLEAMCGHVATMGGRRSRYWCGPGPVRETKTAVPPDRNQAGGALQLFLVAQASACGGKCTGCSLWKVAQASACGQRGTAELSLFTASGASNQESWKA